MNKKVIITNSQGQKVEATVIKAFTLKENNKDYIVYTFGENNDNNVKTYVSCVREENGEYYFDSINDDNEWEKVKDVIVNERMSSNGI